MVAPRRLADLRLKGVGMTGFKGTFAVNFVRLRRMPDYIGLGKSVSRGFGTIVRQKA